MDDRRRRALAAVFGAGFAAYGLTALLSIPRGAREFQYQSPTGGSAFWPPPFAPLNGFTPEQLSSHVARALFLFPACLLLGLAARGAVRRMSLPGRTSIMALSAIVTAFIALFVIRGVPLQDDDATYLMQADLLTRGMAADPSYSPADAFAEPFSIFTPAGMSGMYLFGTPAVLAAGLPFGAPWVGQIALVALTLSCAFAAAQRLASDAVARLGTLLLALSPMLTFTSATPVSQPLSLAGVAVAVLGGAIGGRGGGALLGTGLGVAFVARPQVAVPAAMALGLLYAWRDRRLLAYAAACGLPWLVAVGWYDVIVTGSPFRLPRFAYSGELEQYGFGVILRHYTHTPMKAAALAGVALVRLNGWALGWPVSLIGPALWCTLGCPARRAIAPWAAIAVATFSYQAGYVSIGTSETGAIYHYAALPFIAFATGAALEACRARPWGHWAWATAVLSMLLGTTTFYVEHAARLSRLSAAIEGPRRALRLESPALVLEEAWGARPQEGWVFGIPFRDRAPSSPVVRYPAPDSAAALQRLVARSPHRRCYYLWYDWGAGEYRVSACSDIGHHAQGGPPTPSAWYEHGRWKEAFPYVPLPRSR